MLKIKDNVELKELEKFGLVLNYECDKHTGVSYITDIYKMWNNSEQYSLRFQAIPEMFKLVYIQSDGLDTLYDLIKADLVEKVGE